MHNTVLQQIPTMSAFVASICVHTCSTMMIGKRVDESNNALSYVRNTGVGLIVLTTLNLLIDSPHLEGMSLTPSPFLPHRSERI